MEAVNKKILVTGGAGYIGSVLCERLLAMGYSVRVADYLAFGDAGIIGFAGNPYFEFHEGDIRDPLFVRNAIQGMDAVVHLAAIVGDPACAKFPEPAEEINSLAARDIFLACSEAGIRHFIFASTCSNYGVMGDRDVLLTEDSPLQPVSLYAKQKVAFEEFLLSNNNSPSAVTILRFATAYGVSPRMRFDLTVNHFTRDLALGKELLIFGKDLWRPYCHIRDLSQAILKVLHAGPEKMRSRIFNVGDSQENYSKERIANEILLKVPAGKVVFSDAPSADVRNYRVDFSRISAELNFKISFTVPYGIAEVLKLVTSGSVPNPYDKIFENA